MMEAVILAGGFATRLYPLTRNQAKPLLPVADRPAIFCILERLFALRPCGLARIVVLSNERFARDFRTTLSGSHPVPVEVVSNRVRTEAEKLGAVRDMALAASLVTPGQPFLVLAGDNLFDFGLETPVRRFAALDGRSPVVLVRSVPHKKDTKEYNNVRLAGDGRISAFVEKPERPFARRFALCIYVFPPDVRQDLELFVAQGNDPDKAGNFIRWLCRRRPVYGWDAGGTWFDVGSLAELEAADLFFRRKR